MALNGPRITFFLATSGHSGVDRLMKNLIPSIAQRGYGVDLIRIKNHGPFLDKVEGVKVIKLNSSHVYSSIYHVFNYLKKNPPTVFVTDKDRVNRSALLLHLLLREKIDTKFVVRVGTTVSVNLKSRGIIDRFFQRLSMGKLYRYAYKVIVPSNKVAEDMATYTGLPRELIEAIPSPVIDESVFSMDFPYPDHPWFGPCSPPVILGVGELCKRKDFATLIRAFKIVRSKVNAKLIILGKGKQLDYLVSLARELSIQDHIDFPGFVKDPLPYMAHASVFVSSSLWEGTSLVLVESLSVGTPVVSTNCPGGHAEVLNYGEFGELVPIKDPEKMAEAILHTMDNPKDPEVLKSAVAPYSVKNSTDKYLETFGLPPYWKQR